MAFLRAGKLEAGGPGWMYAARAAVYQERGDTENFAATKATLYTMFSNYSNTFTREEGIDELIRGARLKLSGAHHLLAAMEAHGASIDAAVDTLIARLNAFETRVAEFIEEQTATVTLAGDSDYGEWGGLDTSSMVISGWGAAVHQRLLTRAGSFSTYLQGASNTPTGGTSSVEGWVPDYLTLRDPE